MTELVFVINNNKQIVNIAEFKAFFDQMKVGKHLLIHKDYRKRSLPQNAYYWAVVVPMVQKGLYDAGYDDVTDNDIAHEVIKRLFIKKDIVNKDTGEMLVQGVGSTAKLTVPEFEELVEKVSKWSAEYLGIVIPAPSHEYAMLAEWAEEQESIVE